MNATQASQWAEQYGTPLYAYDLAAVTRQVQSLRGALPAGSSLFYSFKSNPLPGLARQAHLDGCRAEITSEGELAAACTAGFDMSQALFGGPGKTRQELQAALEAGVRWFSCESFVDIKKLSDAAVEKQVSTQVLLRVNPTAPPSARLAMTGVESQFGWDESALLSPDAGQRIHLPGVDVQGVHIYFGTQMAHVEAIADNTRRALTTAETVSSALNFTCRIINAGGGFPWPYALAGSADLPGLDSALAAVWDASPYRNQAALWFESGRYVSGSSGSLLTRVLDVKVSRSRTFVILDTGIHHLGGMSGLGRIARSPMTILNLSRAESSDSEPVTADIVGPLCTPLDSLARNVQLPSVEPGDILAIPNVGAYGLTASLLGFLSHTPPLELTHREGQEVELWRWQTGHQQQMR